jgi:hypothetical protein
MEAIRLEYYAHYWSESMQRFYTHYRKTESDGTEYYPKSEADAEIARLEAEVERLKLAIINEREECAKISEKYEPDEKQDYIIYASREIRSRNQAISGGR